MRIEMDLRRELLHEHAQAWMELASCNGHEALFIQPAFARTPSARARVNAAIMMCKTCPVFNECKSWSTGIEHRGHSWVDVIIAGKYYPNNARRRKESTQNDD